MLVEPVGRNDITLHEHIELETDDGWRVGFVDPRRFGSVDLIETEREDLHRLLAGLGPEPLDDAFSVAVLAAALEGKTDADQGRPAGPEDRRRSGQHLCVRGAVPSRDFAAAAGVHRTGRAGEAAGAGDQADADRGDRGRRIVVARLCADQRGTRLFPARLEGLWARGRALPHVPGRRRLQRGAADRAGGPQHLLLCENSALEDFCAGWNCQPRQPFPSWPSTLSGDCPGHLSRHVLEFRDVVVGLAAFQGNLRPG